MKDTVYLFIKESPDVPTREKYKTYHKFGKELLTIGLKELNCLPKDNLNQHLLKNRYGKPYFDESIPFFYNISHSDEFIICALAKKEIGIDTEILDSFNESIYKFVLTQEELNYLRTFKKKVDQDKIFLKFWTLKESYIKQLGKGLSFPVQDISFNLEDSVKSTDRDKFFYQFNISPISVVSICYPEDFDLKIRRI